MQNELACACETREERSRQVIHTALASRKINFAFYDKEINFICHALVQPTFKRPHSSKKVNIFGPAAEEVVAAIFLPSK